MHAIVSFRRGHTTRGVVWDEATPGKRKGGAVVRMQSYEGKKYLSYHPSPVCEEGFLPHNMEFEFYRSSVLGSSPSWVVPAPVPVQAEELESPG